MGLHDGEALYEVLGTLLFSIWRLSSALLFERRLRKKIKASSKGLVHCLGQTHSPWLLAL